MNTQVWSVRCSNTGHVDFWTLYEAGKIKNVILEMKRLHRKILEVSKTHWLGSGSFKTNDYTVYFSGAENGPH